MKSRLFAGVCLALVCSFLVPAQSMPTYYTVNYMKAKPGADWEKTEREVSAPVMKALIDGGSMAGWAAYSVISPSGKNTQFDYMTVDMVRNWGDMVSMTEEKWNAALQKAHPGKKTADIFASYDSTRDIVRREIYQLLLMTEGGAGSVTAPGDWFEVVQMKVDPAKAEAYVKMVKDVALPAMNAGVKAGRIKSVALYRMVRPYGDRQPYNFAAVYVYSKFEDMDPALESSLQAKAFETAHPGKDWKAFRDQLWSMRTVVSNITMRVSQIQMTSR